MEGAEDEDGFCTSKRCPPGPSAVPLGSAHADAKQKRITIIDSHQHSPVVDPQSIKPAYNSAGFTSLHQQKPKFGPQNNFSSSSKPTLFYYGLIQQRLRYLSLLEHRASHFFERIKSSIIERANQPLESQPKP